MRGAQPRADGGLLVALEGIDGSGKSVQCARLAAALRARGVRALETREPSDGPFGRRYRAWARGEFEASADEVLDFFIADRAEHLEQQVLPALREGSVVVCDRYEASTRAYQAAHGVTRAALDAALARAAARPADLVLWLRLPLCEALARLHPERRERYEREDFLQRVDAEYAQLPGLLPVDARGTPEQVTARLLAPVLRRLGWPDGG